MDALPQLLQPLSIDTDIVYDLDMSKFPGIDDPHQMFQPALVISTPETHQFWMSALENNELETSTLDDLFQLIESCPVESFLDYPSSGSDSGYIQNFFDNVIDSTTPFLSSDDVLPILDWNACGIPDCCDDYDTSRLAITRSYITSNHGYEDSGCLKRKREPEEPESRKTHKVIKSSNVECFVNMFDVFGREA